jgi:hypothetical protein
MTQHQDVHTEIPEFRIDMLQLIRTGFEICGKFIQNWISDMNWQIQLKEEFVGLSAKPTPQLDLCFKQHIGRHN